MGVSLSQTRREPNAIEQAIYLTGKGNAIKFPKHLRGACNRVIHSVAWIERGGRILKNDLDLSALLAAAMANEAR
jgi:hypothetical protein